MTTIGELGIGRPSRSREATGGVVSATFERRGGYGIGVSDGAIAFGQCESAARHRLAVPDGPHRDLEGAGARPAHGAAEQRATDDILGLWIPAFERVKELLNAAKQGLHRRRACFEAIWVLLSMKDVVDGIKKCPHPEEAAQRLSRRTQCADPADRRFFHKLRRGNDE